MQIILALSSPFVAAFALWLAGKRQAQAFRHEREMADLKDTRALLGEAAVQLHKVEGAMTDVEAAIDVGSADVKGSAGSELLEALSDAGWQLDVLGERLELHLGGESPAVQTFMSAEDAFHEYSTAIFHVWLHEEDPYIVDHQEKAEREHGRLEETAHRFRRAAHDLVGVRLPPTATKALRAGETPPGSPPA